MSTATMNKIAVEQEARALDGKPVPMHLWGTDHYSTLAYAECRLVDNGGTINRQHMRGNHQGCDAGYPTRLRHGVEVSGHGDYDCLFDAEDAGLLVLKGTGLHPVIEKLTERGKLVCAALREHKQDGGSFGTFTYP